MHYKITAKVTVTLVMTIDEVDRFKTLAAIGLNHIPTDEVSFEQYRALIVDLEAAWKDAADTERVLP